MIDPNNSSSSLPKTLSLSWEEEPEPAPKKCKTLERSYPPIGDRDTVYLVSGSTGLVRHSVHGRAKCYADDAILRVHSPVADRVQLLGKALVHFDQTGKSILQQQATRGCTAAACAMLILDHGKSIDPRALSNCNLGQTKHMVRQITKSGLCAIVSGVDRQQELLPQLKALVAKNGPSIINVNAGTGAHSLVLDKVASDNSHVTLRDPYHGWQIDVKIGAFIASFQYDDCIQAMTIKR